MGRESMGLSLLDVYNHIFVPVEYLRAIEQGHLDALPIPTYTIGFLHTYCQFLGLDPEPFVDQYRACLRPRTANRFRPQTLHPPKPHPRWASDLITWAAVCGLLLLGWLSYTVLVQPAALNSPARVNAGTIEAPEAAPPFMNNGL
jgi:cytoskeletal protein RodZ